MFSLGLPFCIDILDDRFWPESGRYKFNSSGCDSTYHIGSESAQLTKQLLHSHKETRRPSGRRCEKTIRPQQSAWPMLLRRNHHPGRSEEHTSELQSLMRISYAVFCLKTKKINKH